MHDAKLNIDTVIGDIRKRWRRRALIQGGAVSLTVLAASAALLLVLYTWYALPDALLTAGGGVAALAVLGAVVQFVVRPLRRRVTDEQIALFVEERIPDLEDRFNSVVEVSQTVPTDREQRILIGKLIDDAARRAGTISPATLFDRTRERVLSFGAAAGIVLFLLLGYASLDDLQRAASGVALSPLPFLQQPAMTVAPGDVEIEKGESQEIVAELREETDEAVVLFYKTGEGDWQRAEMRKGMSDPAYLYEFYDIQEPIHYYVERGTLRSDEHAITLYEFPEVARIDVTYTYPEYTGLAPYTEEDTGDIQGLKGAAATVTVQTTGTVEEAELVLDEQTTLRLTSAGEGRFRGTLRLEDPGSYHVRLTDRTDRHNKFPEEYRIVPEDDERPFITIEDPNQDVRANAVQEVLLAVTVQDDYGVKDVRLRYAVNGSEEQTVALLAPAPEIRTDVTGEHLFFLEDYSLEPGDVISYYVEAEDHVRRETPEATDIYFIEVIPFDQQFTQVNNMGGMPGGGQPSGVVLSQQQIIAATWKLYREQNGMSEEAFKENHEALAQAQSNLRDNIQERISRTAFSVELQTSEENRQLIEYLRQAVTEMEKAIEELKPGRLREAMTPERKALSHLLKADALNTDRQVALGRQSSSGGGGATEERMTELEDLELDISKDKYEMQAQNPSGGAAGQPQLDEAMQRIRDLARRQQNLMNRNEQSQVQGEDRKRMVEHLQRDQNQLQEQAEQLSQAMQQMAGGDRQQAQETQQRLERVAENMREAERALREGDAQQAMARQQQALNELQRLQNDLRLAGGNTREMLEELARNFDEFRNLEQQLGREIREAEEQARARGGAPDPEEVRRLRENRSSMVDNLRDLKDQAEAVASRAREEDRDLATAARNFVQRMSREELEQKMDDSEQAIDRGWLDLAARLEEEIQAGMEGLETQMRELEDHLPQADDEQVAQSLQDLRDLMQQLEAIRAQQEQMAQNQQGGAGSPGPRQDQQSGQQPQEGEGQGQGSGQQGQGGGSRQDRADAARLQRQMDRARETFDRLQEDLEGNATAERAFRALPRSFFGRADHTGVLLEGEAAEAFFNDRVFDPLAQLEMELAGQVEALALERKLYNARRGDAPPEYRELVDRYYEALAKRKQQ